jgi:transposase-like protein
VEVGELLEAAAWKTLRSAIPSEVTSEVAKRFGVTADHVRRWMREPLSDEAPLASGQRSPLDRFCDLLDAIFLSNPLGTSLCVEYIREHHRRLISAAADQDWDRQAHAAHAARETAEAVSCLILDRTPDEETVKEITEARDLLDAALVQILRSRRTSLVGVGDGSPGAQESARIAQNRADSGSAD